MRPVTIPPANIIEAVKIEAELKRDILERERERGGR
jgi:hypothetical protein